MPLKSGAEPAFYEGSPIGVLLVHGFTGSPASMKPWGEYLNKQGFTASVPRLPGHGTSWQEMNKTRWEDWFAEVEHAWDKLRRSCTTTFIFGMSMGGALSTRLAELRGDEVAGIALVNPAFFTTRPDRFLLPVLHHVVPAFPGISNDIKKPGQDEVAYTKIPLKAAHSMTDLWNTTKREIGRVHQPIMVFTSKDDHVVEPENSEWLLEHVNSIDRTHTILPESYHVATLDHDAPTIFEESAAFIKRLTV